MGTVVGAQKIAVEDAAGAETKTSLKEELERGGGHRARDLE